MLTGSHVVTIALLRLNDDPGELQDGQPLRHLLPSHECVLVRPLRVVVGRFSSMSYSVNSSLRFTKPQPITKCAHLGGDSNATCNGTRTRVAPLECTLPSPSSAAAVAVAAAKMRSSGRGRYLSN